MSARSSSCGKTCPFRRLPTYFPSYQVGTAAFDNIRVFGTNCLQHHDCVTSMANKELGGMCSLCGSGAITYRVTGVVAFKKE